MILVDLTFLEMPLSRVFVLSINLSILFWFFFFLLLLQFIPSYFFFFHFFVSFFLVFGFLLAMSPLNFLWTSAV